MIFRTQLIGLFTDNPEVIKIASTVLLLSILLETGRTMNIVIINSLRAAGDAKFPVLIGVFSMVLMSLPLGTSSSFIWIWACRASGWLLQQMNGRGPSLCISDGKAEHGKNMHSFRRKLQGQPKCKKTEVDRLYAQ
jgi:hypothetical protein